MPQALLPLIPHGATPINDRISVVREDGQWTYFCGIQPVFQHPQQDRRSFRMFTAQLCCQAACTQAQIIRTFGVSKNSVLRSVAKYRREGIDGFYRPRGARRCAVMTPQVTAEAERLLGLGYVRREVAAELGIRSDTLGKAIHQGRVGKPEALPSPEISPPPSASPPPAAVSDKSSRSDADAAAGHEMGIACTRPGERVMAALGLLPAVRTEFQSCRDVSYGGVLCALPALAENGLFRHLETLPVLSGYYTTLHVILLLAYMALCRIKAVEQLQYETPGELGKLMGLDRVPEVRCLRKKLSGLSQQEAPQRWAAVLSKAWMEFVADASHELRAPLTAIQANLDLLQRQAGMPAEEQAEAVDEASREAARLARLVANLLMLARADAGVPLRHEPVELDRVLLDALKEARHLACGQSIEVSSLDTVSVTGDSDRLKQLVLIFLDNALKYTPCSGMVSASLRVRDHQAEIEIEDNGSGISAGDLPHVFDRFYRADPARSKDSGGTGLGLSIAKWIAEQHGGTLSMESELGSGTKVIIRLPVDI